MSDELKMDKLDERLLGRIEQILNIKFQEWQVNYILDKPMVLDMAITGRRSGKTLAYIVKLLFKDDKPIRIYDLTEVAAYSDWWSVSPRVEENSKNDHYTKWFRDRLLEIYGELTMAGIITRPIAGITIRPTYLTRK